MPDVIYFKNTVIRGSTSFNGRKRRLQIDTSEQLSWTRKNIITKSVSIIATVIYKFNDFLFLGMGKFRGIFIQT